MDHLKKEFLLDPGVVFLNHGSFGACPRPVFEEYQRFQRKLEHQPVLFLGREILDEMRGARQRLGEFVHSDPQDVVYVPNATFGVNIVARSLNLQAGDEVLITDHEYGACENIWDFLSLQQGFSVQRTCVPLPLPDPEQILDRILEQITSRTRLLFISQITSPTAVQMPVSDLCTAARSRGILTVIDGAHGPGQLPLDLTGLGADFYTGNCHKWLLSPKGAGFLYIRKEHQKKVRPLVVSWGWGENCPYQSDSKMLGLLEYWGTKDPAAYLSVPRAINFQIENNWDQVRKNCQNLLGDALSEIRKLTGMPSIYGKTGQNGYAQMAAVELPSRWQPHELQAWLYDHRRIEIPVISWNQRWLLRISVQGYNTWEDLEELISALKDWKKIQNV
jgi:isopenicillin-N epimerase